MPSSAHRRACRCTRYESQKKRMCRMIGQRFMSPPSSLIEFALELRAVALPAREAVALLVAQHAIARRAARAVTHALVRDFLARRLVACAAARAGGDVPHQG